MSGFFTYKRLGQGVCILRRKTLKRAFIVTALRHRHKLRCDKEKNVRNVEELSASRVGAQANSLDGHYI